MKKHPYIIAIAIATLLATVVWLCVPKEYSATTKISDEYKEIDLSIGLSHFSAMLRDATGGANTGMNDMAVYCKALKSADFARTISHKQVPGKGMTYGEYLGERDTIEAIQDRIDYNYSAQQTTLTISFTDRDAVVAAQMLDSTTAHLQGIVTGYRHLLADASMKHAEQEWRNAAVRLQEARKAYSDFIDSNADIATFEAKQQGIALEREVKLATSRHKETFTRYIRHTALKQRAYMSFATIKANTVPQQGNSHFLSYLLSFIVIALLATKGFFLLQDKRRSGTLKIEWGDFFSPWCLTVMIWTADIALYFIQGTLDPMGPQFLGCFALWLATFLPASLAAFWLSRDDRKPSVADHNKPIDVNMYVFYGLIVLSLLMTLLYARTILNIVNQFDTDNLLYNIRLFAVYNSESLGMLNHTQGINLALFLVAIWLYPRISKLTVFIIVAINLTLELAMMEKSGILIMILGTLFVLYERGKIRIRTIGLTFAGIIVLFFFFNMMKEDSESDTTQTFMDFFGMYITSPMIAFERLSVTITDTFAANTLNDFYPQLLRFGIQIDTIDRLQDFVFVPIPTNVYTIMQPFYNDFGARGVAFFGLLYGSLFGYIYRKFREGNAICTCFYTYLVEVIIIQFYNENLLQIFHLILEASIVIVILVESKKLSLAHTVKKTAAQ